VAEPPGVCFKAFQVAHMFDNLDDLDRWESTFERRSVGRTKIVKGALLFFSEKASVHSCSVRDVTNLGAGIRAQDLKVVPLTSLCPLTIFGAFVCAARFGAKANSSAWPSRADRDQSSHLIFINSRRPST
jgi:hypothetical protein